MAAVLGCLISKYSTRHGHLYYASLHAMENGSQVKRPLDDKTEETSEKVPKQEAVQTPPEQHMLEREGQDPEKGQDPDGTPAVLEPRQTETDESKQAAAVAPKAETGNQSSSDKQSKPWFGFSFRSFSLGFGGAKDVKSTSYRYNLSLGDTMR